ncbi:T9SS type A sorting domain-containing protein [Aequorivita sp. H23M31]|uniref:T9SS type A sorting domain-containing protein n=1 Tax=Aequorivita ciconiae TaxID=2494375 RepID=A0A410G7C6_9FLAO|nr:T9SS type A sorting domain-containing protein [Aequorivita sp. H23M31]
MDRVRDTSLISGIKISHKIKETLNGIYFLNIESKNQVRTTKKIIKE